MLRNRHFPACAASNGATGLVTTGLVTAVLAGTLTLAGCASAAPASAAKTGGTTKAADTSATGSAPASGPANIMVYSVNSDGPDFRALVTGAVGDYGPAVSVHPDGSVDPAHASDLELKLTRGSFRLSIADLDRKFVQVASHEPIYPRTCSDFMNVSAAVPVVAGSGTGAYRGISGSFQVTITADEVEKKPCQPAAEFQWQVIVMAGHGTVSLGRA